VLLYFNVFEKLPKIGYFALLAHGMLWLSATVFDAAILTSTTLACSDSDFYINSYVSYTCNTAPYGKLIIIITKLFFFNNNISININIHGDNFNLNNNISFSNNNNNN
jgi:hypothetical protein